MRPRAILAAAVLGPVALWLLTMTVGGKKGDEAGTMLVGRGLVLPFRFGMLVEASTAAILLTYLLAPARLTGAS